VAGESSREKVLKRLPGATIRRGIFPDISPDARWIVSVGMVIHAFERTEQAAWDCIARGLDRAAVLALHPRAFAAPSTAGWSVFASPVRLLGSGATEGEAWRAAAEAVGQDAPREPQIAPGRTGGIQAESSSTEI
jgi:hypothetical protein